MVAPPPKSALWWLLQDSTRPVAGLSGLTPHNALLDALLALPGPTPLNALSAISALSITAAPPTNALLTALPARPRNRSEWQARFAYWQQPASKSEEAEIEAKARRIGQALRRRDFLRGRSWRVVKQGSYHNNTNTRAGSDMDIGVCLTDAFFIDGPTGDVPSLIELSYEPLPFRFDAYKHHIAWCLEQEFGYGAVSIGKKAIHLHKDNEEKIHADVVPAFTLQRFGPRLPLSSSRDLPQNGIALLGLDGNRVTNFPDQHYANGCAKNDRTGRRFKRVVRIIKRLRDHISLNKNASSLARVRAKNTPSFLLESLVYNCPDELFGNVEIYDDTVAILNYLQRGLNDSAAGRNLLSVPMWALWYEVNGIKNLFGSHQAWTLQDTASFIGDARVYMGV